MMQQIMIIEDDPSIREELTLLLRNEGYHCLPVEDFADVAGQIARCRPDLILLDIGLPGRDGFSLCASLRRTADVPIIFVTSRDSSLDEIQALSLGGDDYITKPYNVPVLLADTLECGRLRLNLTKGTVSAGEKTALLTRNEIQILACLMGRPGEIVSRAELIETLWDHQVYIDDNTLSVNMTRLRGKLEDLGLPDLIRTRRGMGYQL